MAKTKQNYQSAVQELEQIVSDMQHGKTSIDELEAQVLRANELLSFCKNKLRQTESHFKSSMEEDEVLEF